MKDDIKPSTIMLIAGGTVLFISTFLDWVDSGPFSQGGWSTEFNGLLGIIVGVIGVAVAGGTVATKFAGVSLPDEIIGFSHDQIHLALGFAAFLITFGLQFRDFSGIGILIGWIASAVIVAGAYLDIQAGGTDAAPAAPPSQF